MLYNFFFHTENMQHFQPVGLPLMKPCYILSFIIVVLSILLFAHYLKKENLTNIAPVCELSVPQTDLLKFL